MILQSQYSGVQFNNIRHIAVCEFYNEESTFPYWFLKNVPNSESLLVQWSSFTEIFQGEQIIRTEKETQISPQLKQLDLWHLSKLQCICKEGFQMDPVLHFLERIIVSKCSSLTKLVPSSVTFSYMTYLEVTNCNGLKNLITHSTAKSLIKLTTMKIKMCNWLEDIVNGKEDETNEIAFCSLQTLELISLQRLCRFCSCPCPIKFPLLEVVVVKECPRMELFSLGVTNTTSLQNVQTDDGNHWEGDLNVTVKKLFDDKVCFTLHYNTEFTFWFWDNILVWALVGSFLACFCIFHHSILYLKDNYLKMSLVRNLVLMSIFLLHLHIHTPNELRAFLSLLSQWNSFTFYFI